MKISGVKITGGVRLDTTASPTDPSKLVVGAWGDSPNGGFSGSVYVYNTDGTGEVKISPSDGTASALFGWSVDKTSSKIVVGAQRDIATSKGSVYVFNTDGTGQVKVTASDGADQDLFGRSVGISDTHIVVGSASGFGAAYVYNLDGSGQQKIVSSDINNGDRFAASVAINSTKIVVGATGDADAGSSTGSVYVYNLDGTGEVKITASDAGAFDFFGESVAMSDTKVVVGANGVDSNKGAAYVYNTDGTGELRITTSSTSGDSFGTTVAVSDTHILVGAPYSDDAGSASGSAYVYNLDGTGEVKITASDGSRDDYFGRAVALQGDKVIVGGYRFNEMGSSDMKVYMYNLDGTGEQKISPSDIAGDDFPGTAVA